MRRLLIGAAALGIVLAGCGEDDGTTSGESGAAEQVTEAAVRNAASVAGAAAFEAEKVNVDGTLNCTAESPVGAGTEWTLACTGKAEDGAALALNGTLPTDQKLTKGQLTGSFVGMAGNTKVFDRTCLGKDC